MAKISLIAAMADARVIGKDNQMPWHMPADLKHFKAITLNKPVIMGRNTFESLGKPLPGRRNIVLTRRAHTDMPGCEIAHSIHEALAVAGDVDEIMIIGGAQLYAAALPLATHMYLTFIDTHVAGDTYFPAWDPLFWDEISRETHEPDDKNPYAYTFVTFERNDRL